MHMHDLGRFDGPNIWTSVDANIIAKSCTSRKLLATQIDYVYRWQQYNISIGNS